MPIHDWTRVSSGTFHHFHQGWMIALRDTLNAGRLPDGFFTAEQQVRLGELMSRWRVTRDTTPSPRTWG